MHSLSFLYFLTILSHWNWIMWGAHENTSLKKHVHHTWPHLFLPNLWSIWYCYNYVGLWYSTMLRQFFLNAGTVCSFLMTSKTNYPAGRGYILYFVFSQNNQINPSIKLNLGEKTSGKKNSSRVVTSNYLFVVFVFDSWRYPSPIWWAQVEGSNLYEVV